MPLTLTDMASRMADEPKKKGWIPKAKFKPGGEKGKLHREMGIKEGEKIPAGRLRAATHSKDPEIARDAKRAETMKGWHHPKKKSPLYDKRKD
jgi:hypothetical protein